MQSWTPSIGRPSKHCYWRRESSSRGRSVPPAGGWRRRKASARSAARSWRRSRTWSRTCCARRWNSRQTCDSSASCRPTQASPRTWPRSSASPLPDKGMDSEETSTASASMRGESVYVASRGVVLEGDLVIPTDAYGVVAFAHGSGSSRHSPRNRYVAEVLNGAGLATLLLDLLTPDEEAIDVQTMRLRFDIDLLAERVVGTVGWLAANPATRQLRIGLFGASTGAAAALVAAA